MIGASPIASAPLAAGSAQPAIEATADAYLAIPSLILTAGSVPGASTAHLTAPSLAFYATGHDSTGERAAAITLPSIAASAKGGANAKISLSGLSCQATGTVTNAASAALTLPSPTVTTGATAAASGGAVLTLPAMSSKSYAGALCSVTIGAVTAKATGTTGVVGNLSASLPLFEVKSVATAQNHGSAHLMLPSLSLHSGGNGAAITLPGLDLVAIGTATITATYEAYAVNLKHLPRPPNEAVIDEVTRYTNFPFTHVVRYKDSYYGANSTGLYLLEGTTDDDAPIVWNFETALDDFKTPVQKAVDSAFFSGRLGPASTIRILAGEGVPVTYSFTTPRGQLAQNYRQRFGKGFKNRYYALGASGNGELELDGIEPEVRNLTRRI